MRLELFLSFCAVLAACTPVREDGINDPLEGMNRRVHAFNVGMDEKVIRPLTAPIRGGDKGGPGSALKMGIANLGGNLSLPGKVANQLLQGRPVRAAHNTFRFFVNTTLGFGGVLDPATADFGLPEIDTDFGETMYVWGVPEGPYLVTPFIGPVTTRDLAGKVVDWVFDPTGYVLGTTEEDVSKVIKVASKAVDRVRFGDTFDSIMHGSADSYVQIRLLYLMHRRHELGMEATEIDPYAEFDPYAQ